MVFDEESLTQTFELTKSRVISSTSVAVRTSAVIATLSRPAAKGDKKPAIACLTAEAKVASKLVSVVEIAKRDLATKGIKCFQYNALGSHVVDVPRERRKPRGGEVKKTGDAEEADEDAFQTMADPMGATKKRSVPTMTIYLSPVSVKELRAAYGDSPNGNE
ncbi:hypothetical protein LTS10_011250 [Elasticomyces elasticus]|nr:hypothetical protein LTS10_011250 [Elasticomyces elasticus]